MSLTAQTLWLGRRRHSPSVGCGGGSKPVCAPDPAVDGTGETQAGVSNSFPQKVSSMPICATDSAEEAAQPFVSVACQKAGFLRSVELNRCVLGG